ncbi:hypothetical protein PISL3812_07697 [Talaromyces islandicus]|uniref:DUF7719 domain-containing protein n=1 Tax=Talaromyces islandicus TaxID=28573 RepID=A0A0U1M515_TALIS|nr:hypothetical protein PISL3812_07697 [Talaromyces islandicus]
MAQNRKQRRAAAAAAAATTSSAADIPLKRPPSASESRAQQKSKTLLEIAAERQGQMPRLSPRKQGQGDATLFDMDATETQFIQISPDGGVARFNPEKNAEKGGKEKEEDEGEGEGDASLPPVIDTLLLSTPLTTLHLTLAYLAAHQYAQFVPLGALVWESCFVAFPVLTLCIHVAHGHVVSFNPKTKRGQKKSSRPAEQQVDGLWDLFFGRPSAKTLFFLPLAICLGVHLMRLTNEEGYYAVMKRAPSVGTMWVWCVLEMPPGAGLLAFLAPLGWGVGYMGYAVL